MAAPNPVDDFVGYRPIQTFLFHRTVLAELFGFGRPGSFTDPREPCDPVVGMAFRVVHPAGVVVVQFVCVEKFHVNVIGPRARTRCRRFFGRSHRLFSPRQGSDMG